MPIPTWVAAGAPASAVAANITPALPAGWAPDDIFVLACETANQPPSSALTGWTFFNDTATGTAGAVGATAMRFFWRRAVAGDTDPTITYALDHILGVIVAIRGCVRSGNPWNGMAANIAAGSDTSLSTSGGVTAGEDNSLILTLASHGADIATANYSAEACAGVTSLTERVDVSTTNGVGGGIGIWTGNRAAAGTVGSLTATLANASADAFMTLALRGDPGAYQVPSVPFW